MQVQRPGDQDRGDHLTTSPRSIASDTLRARAEALSAAILTDAVGRILSHRAHILDLVSPTPGRKLFGRAITIRFIPYRAELADDPLTFARYFYEAIGDGAEGAVLVLDSAGQHDASVGGGAKFSRLHNRGLAGLITDARIRDFDELAALDPVFYCRGQTVHAGTKRLMPIAANVPVSLDGTTVVPGDYVYADSAGVVIIPSGHLGEVLQSASEIAVEDRKALAIIRKEDPREVRRRGSPEL